MKDRVIFGTMTCGPEGKSGARLYTVEDTRAILATFRGAGYDELDTARAYCEGETERYLAEADYAGSGFALATKVYPITGDEHAPARLREIFETSLRALRADRVDVFYLHAPSWRLPFEETLACVDALHREGKFTTFGLSNYTAWQVAEISVLCRERGWVRPTLFQCMYNAITRAIEPELIPACRKYGLDIVVYNPLAGGYFTGNYRKDAVPETGRFAGASTQGETYRKRYFRDAYFDAIEHLRPVCERHGLTMLETAIRWVVHHSQLRMRSAGGNDGVIIGASSVAHLESNLKDFEKGPLPDEVVATLDECWQIAKVDTPNYWHGDVSVTYQV